MRLPLQKFTTFAQSLLPHETAYLLSVQRFKDAERLEILERVDRNAKSALPAEPYDTHIDKRKYNHLKNWIVRRLEAMDVDVHFRQMLDFEHKIATDSIGPADEKKLLGQIRGYVHPGYSFSRFYELAGQYRHFLLIRLRHGDHRLVDGFLQKHRAAYLESKMVWDKMHEATRAIVGQYSRKDQESRHWEGWLSEVFYNEKLEGRIRYLALVRLVFIGHNYQSYEGVREKLDYLDGKFAEGRYYSKRLLLNYYSTRLMLHSHAREYEQAMYYGYLSIRGKNHDHLFYVNNLCAVLLRLGKDADALELMRENTKEAQQTKNFHNRNGFVAFYMEAMKKNGLQQHAIHYGSTYLQAYGKEILAHRWHLFFSVYLEGLFQGGRHAELLRIARKYNLWEMDSGYAATGECLPSIRLHILASRYKEGEMDTREFKASLHGLLDGQDTRGNTALRQLLEKMQPQVEEIKTCL